MYSFFHMFLPHSIYKTKYTGYCSIVLYSVLVSSLMKSRNLFRFTGSNRQQSGTWIVSFIRRPAEKVQALLQELFLEGVITGTLEGNKVTVKKQLLESSQRQGSLLRVMTSSNFLQLLVREDIKLWSRRMVGTLAFWNLPIHQWQERFSWRDGSVKKGYNLHRHPSLILNKV